MNDMVHRDCWLIERMHFKCVICAIFNAANILFWAIPTYHKSDYGYASKDLKDVVTEINIKKVQKQDFKDVRRCRDGMPKSMQTR